MEEITITKQYSFRRTKRSVMNKLKSLVLIYRTGFTPIHLNN